MSKIIDVKNVSYRGAEPILFGAYVDEVKGGSRFGPVVRSVCIIECNESGYGSIIIEDREFPVGPGDCYVLLPGRKNIHTADKTHPRRGVYCTIGGMRALQIFSEVGITDESPFLPRDASEEITSIVRKMIDMRADTDRGAELRRTACIYEILGAVTRHMQRSDSELWVHRATGIFESEYHNGITVTQVAAEMGFDRSYFSTAFKERVGITPHAYLTSLRIAKACEFLRDPSYSVSGIAESVGLDPTNFARLFKRETGKSPLEYRNGALKKK